MCHCYHVIVNHIQYIINYDEGRVSTEKRTEDRYYGFTSRTYGDVAGDLTVVVPALLITGYVLMILYCGAAFFKFDAEKSRCGAGLVIIIIALFV